MKKIDREGKDEKYKDYLELMVAWYIAVILALIAIGIAWTITHDYRSSWVVIVIGIVGLLIHGVMHVIQEREKNDTD